jgi:hypothetical protein
VPVWRARPNIEPPGLDVGGTCGIRPEYGNGGFKDAREGALKGLGGMEFDVHKGGGC